MAMPTCSSMGKSFFWYEDSSSALRCYRVWSVCEAECCVGVDGGVEEGERDDERGDWGVTLIATSTACVLLAMPTTTEPCFTASAAYSTWNIRPCGELEGRGQLHSLNGKAESLQGDGVVVVIISEHIGSR